LLRGRREQGEVYREQQIFVFRLTTSGNRYNSIAFLVKPKPDTRHPMKTLAQRLAARKAGKYVSPFAPSYSSRWGGQPFPIGENVGYRHTFGRWHECPETPFRFVGLSHDLVSLRHTGWYTCEDCCSSELARGVVYMLPHNRYLAAIADPDQSDKDGTGPCIVEVNANGSPVIYDGKDDAARAADSFAERYAESAREDDRRWHEARRHEEQIEESQQTLDESRDEARALIADIRASKLSTGLCERMRGELRALRRSMHRAFRDIREARQALSSL
jgi:hypothetical protein